MVLKTFDKSLFLDKYLSEFGQRLYEVHFSENNGKTDEHRPLSKSCWQVKALKDICAVPVKGGLSRIFCLEAGNSGGFNVLKENIELIEGYI